jgi:TolB protein
MVKGNFMREGLIISLALLPGLSLASLHGSIQGSPAPFGIFQGATDIGNISPPGSTNYSPGLKTYAITAAGADIWFKADDMRFVWTRVSGDVALEADIDIQSSGAPHRKAVLMLRQSLDADSAYADASLHGDRMTAVQTRMEKGGITSDIELHFDAPAPQRLRIEKHGDTMTMWVSAAGEPMHQVAKPMQVHLEGSFYAGLGVCSHDKDLPVTVVFSHVKLETLR